MRAIFAITGTALAIGIGGMVPDAAALELTPQYGFVPTDPPDLELPHGEECYDDIVRHLEHADLGRIDLHVICGRLFAMHGDDVYAMTPRHSVVFEDHFVRRETLSECGRDTEWSAHRWYEADGTPLGVFKICER